MEHRRLRNGTKNPRGANSSKMNIVEYKNTMQAQWDAYVLQHEQGTLFHMTSWQRISARAFGYKPHYLAATEDGGIRGVVVHPRVGDF